MADIPKNAPEWFVKVMTGINGELSAIKSQTDSLPALQAKVVEVEAEVKAVDVRVTQLDADRKRDKADTDRRLDKLEGSAPRTNVKPSITELFSREATNLERLLDEARQMEGTVIIGKQPSANDAYYNEAEVRRVVNTISGNGTTLEPRGTAGVFALSFRRVAATTPAVRARNFIQRLSKLQASQVMWAQFDRPRELREHDRRARACARSFKAKLVPPPDAARAVDQAAAKSPVFFTTEKGFLVINDVVIGPVTLIPEEDCWPQLFDLMLTLIKNPRCQKINRSKNLASQMHKAVANFLYDVYTAVPDDYDSDSDDDDGMDDGELFDYVIDESLQPPPPVPPPLLTANGFDLLAPLPTQKSH
jgi:hypothetical protein